MQQYNVTGMSCAACSARIEKAVSKVSGVSSCSVNLLTGTMGVEGSASTDAVIQAVEKAGYGAAIKSSSGLGIRAVGRGGNDNQDLNMDNRTSDSREHLSNSEAIASSYESVDPFKEETRSLRNRLVASAVFLIILMYFSMGHMMWDWPLPSFFEGNHVAMGIIQLLLTIAIMVINRRFFISGFKSLRHGAPNMDTLVALGSSAAFGYSTFALFAMTGSVVRGDTAATMEYMHEFYFESAAMILTLITVGKMLEARSKGRTSDALKGLMKLAPKTATVVREGEESVIPIESVRIGDILVVKPGEKIPVDGIICDGTGAVDESALTGESVPVDKKNGDAVYTATLNMSGYLRIEATGVGEDTTLSQIIRMVSDAAATKAPIAKVADRVSGIFVPVVIALSIITMVIWMLLGYPFGYALARGISVLVISCPCALGLATPVAIMVGNGVGARNGILFKTAVSLENAGKINIAVLDKTGTITAGHPKVTDIIPGNGVTKEELLFYAYALEKKSEHPLSKAVIEYAEEGGLSINDEVQEFTVLPGNGLSGVYVEDEKKIHLFGGNERFISSHVNVPSEMTVKTEKLAEQGKTPLFFAKEKCFLGMIAVADVIKEDSPKAVKELQKMGIRVVMLTGDNERTARTIGRQAGVDEVIAGVLPDGKDQVVQNLKEKGRVAMVGDGINDAPALMRADIGIAIGAGTDIAIDAADVVLMKSRLSDVPAAIHLSRATFHNIRENLFWAFGYNLIGIPLAAGVFIPFFHWELNPMFGAAAMSISSFLVVTNALRLNWFKFGHNGFAKSMVDQMENNMVSKEEKEMVKIMKIEGMMCGHCEGRVKKCLEALPQVESATVSHESGTAILQLSEDVDQELLKNTVEAEDYKVVSVD